MSNYLFPFEKLEVWQLSVDLAEFVLDLLDNFPKNRYLRLVGQKEINENFLPESWKNEAVKI